MQLIAHQQRDHGLQRREVEPLEYGAERQLGAQDAAHGEGDDHRSDVRLSEETQAGRHVGVRGQQIEAKPRDVPEEQGPDEQTPEQAKKNSCSRGKTT
jgi:hypothetical protein